MTDENITDHATDHGTDVDELLVSEALRRVPLHTPDLARVASDARVTGTRVRRRRQALTCAAAAVVVGAGSVGLSVASGASGSSGGDRSDAPAGFAAGPTTSSLVETSPAPGQPTGRFHRTCVQAVPPVGRRPRPRVRIWIVRSLGGSCDHPSTAAPFDDPSTAYALLDAPGWTAPRSNVVADEKLYYTGPGDASVSLDWRPASSYGPKYTEGDAVSSTTIDGDHAPVYGVQGGPFTVVGPVRDGHFLTLDTAGLTLPQVLDLAPHVHRQ